MAGAPAFAQGNGYDSLDFISAVQKSDGNKATQLLNDHPDDRRCRATARAIPR